MATGTPVVALNRGAVPELVRPGLTGLICDDPDDLPAALREVDRLDPEACVTHVAENFSTARMALGYEAVYRRLAAIPSGHREMARLTVR
jgi:glycosyltransferase involved in cell wall biosynthesis